VFEAEVLRTIYASKKCEVSEQFGIFHKEGLLDL
jgi:hypothetical protein